jgi:hypothetical protein
VKLVISVLFVSAIAASAASGAELPSRNAPPPAAKAETCSIDGAPGVLLPGGQTCVRISGAVSAAVAADPLSRQGPSGQP